MGAGATDQAVKLTAGHGDGHTPASGRRFGFRGRDMLAVFAPVQGITGLRWRQGCLRRRFADRQFGPVSSLGARYIEQGADSGQIASGYVELFGDPGHRLRPDQLVEFIARYHSSSSRLKGCGHARVPRGVASRVTSIRRARFVSPVIGRAASSPPKAAAARTAPRRSAADPSPRPDLRPRCAKLHSPPRPPPSRPRRRHSADRSDLRMSLGLGDGPRLQRRLPSP
ncbi:hypothetical protein D3C77_386120 [compost metagenome]